MSFTEEEIRNLELLLLNPQVENIRLALAILENKEYPEAIKILLEEYQEWHKIRILNSEASIDQICFLTNNDKNLKIDRESKEIGLFKKIIGLEGEGRYSWKNKPFHKMVHLEELSFRKVYEGAKEDFSILKTNKSLKKLAILRSDLEKLPTILSDLVSLEFLDLSYNYLYEADLMPLLALKSLKHLVILASEDHPVLIELKRRGVKITSNNINVDFL